MTEIVKPKFSNAKITNNQNTYSYNGQSVKLNIVNNKSTYNLNDYSYVDNKKDLKFSNTNGNLPISNYKYTGSIVSIFDDLPDLFKKAGIGKPLYNGGLKNSPIDFSDIDWQEVIGGVLPKEPFTLEDRNRMDQKFSTFMVSFVTSIANPTEKKVDMAVLEITYIVAETAKNAGHEDLAEELKKSAAEFIKYDFVGNAQDFYFDELEIDEDIANGPWKEAGKRAADVFNLATSLSGPEDSDVDIPGLATGLIKKADELYHEDNRTPQEMFNDGCTFDEVIERYPLSTFSGSGYALKGAELIGKGQT